MELVLREITDVEKEKQTIRKILLVKKTNDEVEETDVKLTISGESDIVHSLQTKYQLFAVGSIIDFELIQKQKKL